MSALLVTMIAGATLAMSPSLGIFETQAPPSASRSPVSWAAVGIAKPTYTPSPVPTSTSTPVPTIEVVSSPTEAPTVPAVLTMQDASQGAGAGGKSIEVSISDQHLLAYENGQVVFSFVASTGMRNSTRVGNFSILDKIDNAYGSTWDIWMPNWMGIYYSSTLENGIHALPILPNGNRLWSGYLGVPISFGCVVLGTEDAAQLYNWADIGTPVNIHW